MATKKTTTPKAVKPKVEKKAKKAVATGSLEAAIYSISGKETGKISLSESFFGLPWNADFIHQVITSMQSNARQGSAHAKNRSEVRGGGKKPWRQKGTGRARHGSSRSPIWVGGGTTHGPRNDKNYDRKINKIMKAKAVSMILSKKLKEGEVIFVDTLSMKEPKTKEAVAVLKGISSVKGFESLSTKRKNAALIGIPEASGAIHKSFRNIGSIAIDEVRNWSPVDLMNHKYAVIVNPEASVKTLETRLSK
jgi:large subunit ribosomal protein L4